MVEGPTYRIDDQMINQLEAVVGPAHCLATVEDRALYGYDATIRRALPDLVVRPASTDEVAAVLAICSRFRIPVVARGSATGLSGGSVPLGGGVALDMTRMNRIEDIRPEDLYAVVEAGVTVERFQAAVSAVGLMFPPDPGSARAATMGGSLAENAGGPRAFKYGVFRDYTLGLTAVLADGRIIQTGGRTVKNVSGYDMTRLFVGSEGTLGVITRAIMRLIPAPEARRTLLCDFLRLEDAAETVSRIIAAGMRPAALEFMDDASVKVVEQFLHLGLPTDAAALLLIEVDGPTVLVDREAEAVAALCRAMGARSVQVARTAADAEELWKARKAISSAVARIKPSKVSEDATVPRSRIPDMVRALKRIGAEYGVDLVIFGHAGDGNLHPNIMCDERDPEEMERVWQAVAEIFAVTLELGGTLTGEHGIGYMKAPFLEWEHGEAGVAAMRAVKDAFDPLHILNPGKIFPDDCPPWPVSLEPWTQARRAALAGSRSI